MTKRKSKGRQRTPARQNRSRTWPYLLLGTLGLVAVVAVIYYIVGGRSAPPSLWLHLCKRPLELM